MNDSYMQTLVEFAATSCNIRLFSCLRLIYCDIINVFEKTTWEFVDFAFAIFFVFRFGNMYVCNVSVRFCKDGNTISCVGSELPCFIYWFVSTFMVPIQPNIVLLNLAGFLKRSSMINFAVIIKLPFWEFSCYKCSWTLLSLTFHMLNKLLIWFST